ncbi:hypothetical protein LLEC1_03737 [Akanthomyces lecanii]|uniref:Serine/threonine-protein kinase ppk6 n=1 Tax=Cordyceps confragosa TaxID=2714763 RepID=A0A179IE82_CORDF|nr:hypothetical protein LLEC1_03737 [Akanthomyces lecanii]
MSADLFAEFNQPAAKQTQAAPSQPSQPPSYQSAVNAPAQRDPFDFGYGGHSSSQLSPGAQQWSSFPSQPAAPTQTQTVADEDDGWGDFEVADSNASQQVSASQVHQQKPSQTIAWPSAPAAEVAGFPPVSDRYGGNASSHISLHEQHQQQYEKPQQQQQILQQELWDQQRSFFMGSSVSGTRQSTVSGLDDAWSEPTPKRKDPVASQAADSGVLFDAADFELEDGEFGGESDEEFGDFESVKAAVPAKKPGARAPSAPSRAPPQSSMPSIDLLSMDDPTPAQKSEPAMPSASSASSALRFGLSEPTKPQAGGPVMHDVDFTKFEKQAAPVNRQPKAQLKTQPHTKPKAQPNSKASTPKQSNAWAEANDNDDEWAAWDDAPNAGGATSADAISMAPASSWDWDSIDPPSEKTPTASDSTPPPVNVPPPSVLLSLFPELLSTASALFKSTSGQSGGIKEQILSNPKAVHFLQGYILLATTAARIIAGRKHRWHRDKILAKSMSISAAGSKGMKLAGVDKTQAAREDREAADVVAVWREHVGRLRSAVSVANTSAKASLKVPELSESLSAHTAKLVGTAPKPCVICGLKRDERISKVDFEVEDSFGEWWVEHWGHRACKNFWVEHERNLRLR